MELPQGDVGGADPVSLQRAVSNLQQGSLTCNQFIDSHIVSTLLSSIAYPDQVGSTGIILQDLNPYICHHAF